MKINEFITLEKEKAPFTVLIGSEKRTVNWDSIIIRTPYVNDGSLVFHLDSFKNNGDEDLGEIQIPISKLNVDEHFYKKIISVQSEYYAYGDSLVELRNTITKMSNLHLEGLSYSSALVLHGFESEKTYELNEIIGLIIEFYLMHVGTKLKD